MVGERRGEREGGRFAVEDERGMGVGRDGEGMGRDGGVEMVGGWFSPGMEERENRRGCDGGMGMW